MSYCINPKCSHPSDPKNIEQLFCVNCGSSLILQQRYRVIQPLGKGGCGEVFEIDDNGTTKVLKRLNQKSTKIISLFKQEAKVLSRLQHPGIPKVEKDGYFLYQPEGIRNPIHCLVMEKIEGVNLAEWLEFRENKPIGEEEAIAWLLQLIDILEKLHQNHYFHRDIKPSNIMLKPDGQLVLIDFGTVREITDTYLAKIGTNKELTSVHTYGYTPVEQINGKPLPQSDFFALGRTFVYLLTGKEPDEFEENSEAKLSWRDSATHISQSLADLIDWLMEPLPGQRPPHTEIIRQCLKELQAGNNNLSVSKIQNIHRKPKILEKLLPATTVYQKPRWRGWQIVMFSSFLATSLVMGVRYMSWLERWELPAFDRLMQMRPDELVNPRILVIEITQEDINKYVDKKYKTYSLRDSTLAQSLQKIERYKPRLIGLDMHRYQPRPPGREELITRFQQNQNLLTVCSFWTQDSNYAPLDELKNEVKEKFGFSDIETNDRDKIVRRQVLSYDPNQTSRSTTCTTPYSFSFYLAKRFLAASENPLNINKNGEWQLGKVVFKKLGSRYGGYQNLDGQSNQIMINYRSPWGSEKIAKSIAIRQFLESEADSQLRQLVEGKIVLIGYTAPVAKNYFNTPLGKMPGVWIHAQMTSQILSAVMDNRSLIWVLPQWGNFQWGDCVFVWVWGAIGGMLAWYLRSLLKLGLASGVAVLICDRICLTILIQGGWMPFVPSVLSLFCTGGFVIYIAYKHRK